MATFTGTDLSETITPDLVSASVTANPAGSKPSEAADTINGGGGDDTLDGGFGGDIINGGLGDDTIEDSTPHWFGDGTWVPGLNAGNAIHGNGGNDAILIDIVDSGAANPVDNAAYGDDGNDAVALHVYNVDQGFPWAGDLPAGKVSLYGDAGDNLLEIRETYVKATAMTSALYGGPGNDDLRATVWTWEADGSFSGGDNVDNLYGGTGDDAYFVLEQKDTVVENAGEGYDTVTADKTDYVLPANVEKLVMDNIGYYAEDTFSGTGNALDNVIVGWSSGWGDDGVGERLNGGAGNDTIYGSQYAGGYDRDTIHGGDGNDTIYGTGTGGTPDARSAAEDVDKLYGDAGNDEIFGLYGDDLIYGGTGDDRLWGQSENDTLYGGDGNDTMGGGSGNDKLYGEAGNDTIGGTAGDDLVDGGVGNDILNGEDGNDTIYGKTLGIAQGTNTDADTIHGGAGNDLIFGGAGNADTWDGDDKLYGDDGNDEIYGHNGNDLFYGGTGNDRLWGQAGNDTLYGGTGADAMGGGSGNDTLYGEADNDVLAGTGGADKLSGGPGNDTYDFDYVSESAPGTANRDTILDFAGVGAAVGDRIDLSTIDANAGVAGNQAFVFGGSGAGHVWAKASGTDTLIQADVGAAAGPDLEILVKSVAAAAWTAADFIL